MAAASYARASRRSDRPPTRPTRADVAALLRDGHRLSVRTVALGVVPLAVTAVAARLGPVPLAGQQGEAELRILPENGLGVREPLSSS